MNTERLVRLLSLVVFSLLTACGGGMGSAAAPDAGGELVGAPAPEFSLTPAGGGDAIGPRTFAGKVLIIDFWATWCAPCTSAMPVLEEMSILYGDRGVRVLSVNTEGFGMARAARAMAERLTPSALVVSDDGSAARLYNVSTIPHMLVIDRQGTVRWVKRGFGSAAGLRSDLRTVIEELL